MGHAGFFHELDAWTEYWDIHHPETNSRFYRGDGDERGLLTLFIPGPTGLPPNFAAWKRRALGQDLSDEFSQLAAQEPVASAALELDDLACRVVRSHVGDPAVSQTMGERGRARVSDSAQNSVITRPTCAEYSPTSSSGLLLRLTGQLEREALAAS